MPKRTKKIIIIVLIVYFLLITWHTLAGIEDNMGILSSKGSVSVYLFFGLQSGGGNDSVLIDVVQMSLLTSLGAEIFIYLKNNNSLINVQQRIGYKKFLKRGVSDTFFAGLGLSLLTNLYEMLLINWFYFPFVYKSYDKYLVNIRAGSFSTNQLTEVILYIILSAIGWGIFALLIFAIGLFVRKTAIYFALGPVVGLILILLVLVGNVRNVVWRTFSFVWFLYTLVAPGQYTFMSMAPPIKSWIAFFIACVIYLTIAGILIGIWYRKETRTGQ